jgi:hypothetical protein
VRVFVVLVLLIAYRPCCPLFSASQERESLHGFIAARFDEILSKLLSTEDSVRVREKSNLAQMLLSLRGDESVRNRGRVAEILALHQHNVKDAEAMMEEMVRPLRVLSRPWVMWLHGCGS